MRYIRELFHKERITLRLDDVPKMVWGDCNLQDRGELYQQDHVLFYKSCYWEEFEDFLKQNCFKVQNL